MPIDDAESARHLAIHATAVAIHGLAVLIRGRSRSGKSTLALDLIAASTPAMPILLVGDDRVLLRRTGDGIRAAPHPLIQGKIEKRGYGILTMPFRTNVPVFGLIDLGEARPCDLLGENFPSLSFVNEIRWGDRCFRVRAWFSATSTAHTTTKRPLEQDIGAKDSNW